MGKAFSMYYILYLRELHNQNLDSCVRGCVHQHCQGLI